MIYKISNDRMTVEVSSLGAELQSIRSADGREYLWQGEPSIWSDRAPNLFPFVARLHDGVYSIDGNTYEMKIHGFVKSMELTCVERNDSYMVFELCANEETLSQYPRLFRFAVRYELIGNKLEISYIVENLDSRIMYFGLGGHPGFNIPIEKDKAFEDYSVVFSEVCDPKRIIFSDRVYVDHTVDYPLENGTTLHLSHDLFDQDAIVLTDVPHSLDLSTDKGEERIHIEFPGMDYVGFWHRPKTEAPYVCVEPWVTLPGDEYAPTVFEEKKDLISLEPGDTYVNTWSISVEA